MPKTEEKRQIRPAKRKKNESLEILRNVAKSMAGAVPFASDETKATIEDSLARPMSGLASQLMSYNESTGEVENAAMANLRRIWNSDARRKAGLPPEKRPIPGLVADSLSLPNILGNGPEWSKDMQNLADATHQGVNQGMDLAPPEGFRQHALDSAGVMLGQLPVPGKAKAEAVKDTAKGALELMKRYGKKALGSPIEFMSPTIEPKMSNYLFGTAAGGGLGALGDEVPMEEPPPPRAVARAKGGKVGALQQMLKALNLNPDAASVKKVGYQIGDPVEEVLYATNEGQRKGVLSGEEAKQIKLLLETGEEEALADALLDLHARLQTKSPTSSLPVPRPLPKPDMNDPQVSLDRDLGPMNPYALPTPPPGSGHGKLTQEEWEQQVLRKSPLQQARGGRIHRRY
jgi:hypothetical protein